MTGTTKTFTLAQAQQMGYLTGAKIVPHITTTGGKQTIMLNKTTPPKGLKIVPQVKTPFYIRYTTIISLYITVKIRYIIV